MIVDDEQSVRESLAASVEGAGYTALQADCAENAEAILRSTQVDAFVLDAAMPAAGGIDLCRNIRATEQYKTVPIMLLTGATSNPAEAFAAGCDDLIEKPVDLLILQARLKCQIQRAEYARLLASTRKRLARYVSKRAREVAESAARNGTLPAPRQQEVAILFTDVRGFTALSEEISPVELFSLVSSQLAIQVNLVYEHGGYVDKFGGDGLMVVFDGEDRAVQSCLCAMSIIEAAHRNTRGDGRIWQIGIGIHLGQVVVGNLGSPERLDYSVIGNAVNLAARLCGQAAPMSIVVSQQIHDAVRLDDRLRFADGLLISIRGIKIPVTVYRLLAGEETAPH